MSGVLAEQKVSVRARQEFETALQEQAVLLLTQSVYALLVG
jgi:hypothetical protein